MKIGCFIRSVGERTEGLCFSSVKQSMDAKNIHMIKNIYPFSEAVKKMLLLAQEKNYDWYLGLDADIVLVDNWRDILENTMTHNINFDKYYSAGFYLIDRFVPLPIHAVHFYNTKFCGEMLRLLRGTKDTSKPEGHIRTKIKAPFYAPLCTDKRCKRVGWDADKKYIGEGIRVRPLGYHGFEQSYRDIFYRFALRACRNKKYLKKNKMLLDVGQLKNDEERIARKGWNYGYEHRKEIRMFLDARKRKPIEKFGFREIDRCKMKLKEFYELVKKK